MGVGEPMERQEVYNRLLGEGFLAQSDAAEKGLGIQKETLHVMRETASAPEGQPKQDHPSCAKSHRPSRGPGGRVTIPITVTAYVGDLDTGWSCEAARPRSAPDWLAATARIRAELNRDMKARHRRFMDSPKRSDDVDRD